MLFRSVLDAAVKRGIAERTELPVAFISAAPEDQTEEFKEELKLFVRNAVSHCSSWKTPAAIRADWPSSR